MNTDTWAELPEHYAWNPLPIFRKTPENWQRYRTITANLLNRLKACQNLCSEIGSSIANALFTDVAMKRDSDVRSFISNAEEARLFEEYVQREAQHDADQAERARRVLMVAVTE